MLRECIEWLFSPRSRTGRALGLDREAVAIAARYRRCGAAWAPHLTATRRAILETAAACPRPGCAVLLGSGACLDVPLTELAAGFATVLLVDAIHPRSVRRLARRLGNVRLVEADITGLGRLVERVRPGRGVLPEPLPPPELVFGRRPDLTVSVNLASQLPLPLLRRLSRSLPEGKAEALRRSVIAAHARALARLPGRVGLICDLAWEKVAEGRVVASRDALAGVALPPPDRTWTWAIAPRPEESPAYDRQNRVGVWLDFAAAWQKWKNDSDRKGASSPSGRC